MNPVTWLFEHTVGWLFDHTVGWAAGRVRRGDQRRSDLAALSEAVAQCVAACHKVGRGFARNSTYQHEALAAAEAFYGLSTRIGDEDVSRLAKAARDGVRSWANDFMQRQRAEYEEPCDALLARIAELQR